MQSRRKLLNNFFSYASKWQIVIAIVIFVFDMVDFVVIKKKKKKTRILYSQHIHTILRTDNIGVGILRIGCSVLIT